MQLIDPYADSSTYKKIVAKYGGEYSFFEKLKIRGVGSPKVSYVSGIPEFDVIHYTNDLEHSMTNFELLKAGLIIRINKRQKLAVAIEHLNQLESIVLKKTLVSNDYRETQKGQLIITFKNQRPIYFDIGTEEINGVQQFFQKQPFAAYWHEEN